MPDTLIFLNSLALWLVCGGVGWWVMRKTNRRLGLKHDAIKTLEAAIFLVGPAGLFAAVVFWASAPDGEGK